MSSKEKMRDVLQSGGGILRLIPAYVPRAWGKGGRRLRLHPDDYYAMGMSRGEIKERWFSSICPAYANPDAPKDEGMSYVQTGKSMDAKILLKDFMDTLGREIIGDELMGQYGTWPMYAKFFDFRTPIFDHVHLTHETAANVGKKAKPESYYFPPQLNSFEGDFPYTFFGFDSNVAKEDIKKCLENFELCDNKITELSKAYRLKLGTGWFVPAGVLHAPGSYLTYEPQWNSDVNAIFENVTAGEVNRYDSLVQQVPKDKKRDLDYIMTMLDWDKNIDPNFRETYFRPPVPARKEKGFSEKWISYANDYFCATELTIEPEQTVIVKDPACYGCIFIQGHGEFGVFKDAEAAQMLRFGQTSADEYFVSESTAQKGVRIVNHSSTEPIVMLKHFGPNNYDAPKATV